MTQEWQEGFRVLSRQQMPCYGFSGNRWADTYDIIQAFLAERAEMAAHCGWSTLELFGVHPTVGVARVEYCGALTVAGSKVLEVSRDAIRYTSGLAFRRVPIMPAVPVWAFGRHEKSPAGPTAFRAEAKGSRTGSGWFPDPARP